MAKLETCGEKGLAQQGSKDALLEGLEDFLRENAERRLCMAAVDVEHFKLDEAGCNWEQYSPSMREKLKQRQQLLIEIERALQNKEFCFYLQPKCNSMTHAIVGMEALVRWNHPTRGIVSPGEFVPLMEETGLITRLDLYLWEEVCQMLQGWKARNENMVPISVNVSISDIAALDVAQVLWELVQKYQLEPKLLLVEITESMLAQNLKMVENTIAALHRKGFAVLMDDFGSGYSSLNMLRNTSVDAIKLDMQFIVRDSESSKGRQIVESVIEMARRLNLPIIAEGVETQEQVFMLQSMDCLYTQGYYFYKPMAVKQAEELLAQPAMENYWDLRRDMTRRNYKAFTGGLVSEKSAITLQAFQILADNALILARLDTGYRGIPHRQAGRTADGCSRRENASAGKLLRAAGGRKSHPPGGRGAVPRAGEAGAASGGIVPGAALGDPPLPPNGGGGVCMGTHRGAALQRLQPGRPLGCGGRAGRISRGITVLSRPSAVVQGAFCAV